MGGGVNGLFSEELDWGGAGWRLGMGMGKMRERVWAIP